MNVQSDLLHLLEERGFIHQCTDAAGLSRALAAGRVATPTHARRPNSSPPCRDVPSSTLIPDSSMKMARLPPPSSSLPRNPRREPETPPLWTRVAPVAPAVACSR